MTNVKKHLSLLGLKVKDKVTGYTGVVASIGFDLYGCVQAIVNPGMDKDGKLPFKLGPGTHLAAADVDGDGREDLIVVNAEGQAWAVLNPAPKAQ